MSAEWQTQGEAGTRHAIASMRWIALHLGRTAAGIVLWPVAAYFFAVRPRQRAAAADFLGRILGRKPYAWERLRHFYIFSRVSADRLYLLAGELDRLRIRVHGRELLERISASRRGSVVLSSHLGSFEATRAASLLDERVDLHVVIDRGVNPTFTHYLEKTAPELAARVIDARSSHTAIALRAAEVVARGGWIGLPADRRTAGAASVESRFLGEACRLPRGPFLLAAALAVPVVMATGLYLDGGYELYFEELPVHGQAGRNERDATVARLATEFARRLERYARMAPMNWFNFYDFWDHES